MVTRVEVKPELLRWARERARLPMETLLQRFPKLREWEAGEAQPTFRQLEAFADTTAAPFGYFFLPEPPDEPLPIPDFRTLGDKPIRRVQISEFPTGDFGSNRQAVSAETDRPFRSKAAPRCGGVSMPALANRCCGADPILL